MHLSFWRAVSTLTISALLLAAPGIVHRLQPFATAGQHSAGHPHNELR